jgi:hypothetical protein
MFIESKMTVLHYFLWRITVRALIYGIIKNLKIAESSLFGTCCLNPLWVGINIEELVHSGWG